MIPRSIEEELLQSALLSEEEEVRLMAARRLRLFSLDEIQPTLVQALQSELFSIRKRAITLLEELDAPVFLSSLQSLLLDSQREISQTAARLLTQMSSPSVIPALVAGLQSLPEEDLPPFAVALQRLGAYSALPTLVEIAARRPRWSLQGASWWEIVDQMSVGASVADLLPILASSSPGARAYVVALLGQREAKGCEEEVAALASDPEAEVRLQVCLALGRMKGEEAAESLLLLLRDSYPLVRVRAAEALGEGSYANASNPLARCAARDPHPQARVAALKALGAQGLHEHLPVVQRSLRDRKANVRRQAIETLGEWCLPGTFRHLATLREDPSPRVRLAVVTAARRFGDRRGTRRVLKSLCADSSAPVREAARRVLRQWS